MIEYYQGKDGLWYWRYRADNSQISIIGGEGYSTKSNVKRAYLHAAVALSSAVMQGRVKKVDE